METLVKEAIKGDDTAFVRLIGECRQSMYRTAWVYLKNDEDAADAIQDTILTCYEKLGTLKNPRFFKTWLIRILINKCKDLLSTRQAYDTADWPDRGACDPGMELCEWKELLGCLDQTSQEIMLLFYFEDMPIKEIAALLDMNKNTVATKLKRSREQLRDAF